METVENMNVKLDNTANALLAELKNNPSGVLAKTLASTLQLKYGTTLAALKRLKKAGLANDALLDKVPGKRGRVSRLWLSVSAV